MPNAIPNRYCAGRVTLAAIAMMAGPIAAARGQIVPADDGVATQIEPLGGVMEIRGGQLSGDRANLFHSFERFDLGADETANFVATPDVQNILGRVTGGNVLSIEGLLQVSGSSADLFLMNPAGIVFGESARLDVAGDFTATTAQGIEFESGWFDSLAVADWGELVGEPIAFDFSDAASGSIVNLGDLAVSEGSGLSFLGGSVVNTGELAAGRLRIAAIEGGNMLRLSTGDNVLSLEVAADRVAESGIVPLALPELLAVDAVAGATELVVADGEVRLRDMSIGIGYVALVNIAGSPPIPRPIASTDVMALATSDVLVGSNSAVFAASGGDVAIAADGDKSGEGSIFARSPDTFQVRDNGSVFGSTGLVTQTGNLQLSGQRIDIDFISTGNYILDTGEEITPDSGGEIVVEARESLRVG